MMRFAEEDELQVVLAHELAQENPESIGFAHTHPTTAERFVRMERGVGEIRARKEAGRPLRPEMEGEGGGGP